MDQVGTGEPVVEPSRKRLPDTRPATTVKVSHGSSKGYVTVGFYPDTELPGEIFVKIAKEGSTMQAMIDNLSRMMSYLLQTGCDVRWVTTRISNHKFDPYSTYTVGGMEAKHEDGTVKFGTILDCIAEAIIEACDTYGEGLKRLSEEGKE